MEAVLDELKTSIFDKAEDRDPLRWSSFKYDPLTWMLSIN
jgi:hypothetical protein